MVFFFQAEDGIRDLTVTDVCSSDLANPRRGRAPRPGGQAGRGPLRHDRAGQWPDVVAIEQRGLERAGGANRSEERRVGGGCRAPWTRCTATECLQLTAQVVRQ